MMKRYILSFLILLMASTAGAVTTNLADCAQSTVQSAINSSTDGDILVCPAGSWSWSNVDIINHNITLKGGGIGVTIISITAAGGIEATTANTKAFRITGFTFRSTGNFGIDTGEAMMRIYGGKDWRIDHNEFQIFADSKVGGSVFSGNGIKTQNNVAGLIDHNRFVNHPSQLTSGGCMHASVWPERGETSWDLPSNQIGAATNTIFIEDNYFREAKNCAAHNSHAVYGGRGSIYVFRHNEVRNMMADSHGNETVVGAREHEISNNRFIMESGRGIYRLIFLRGGTGVVYGNTVEGPGTWSYGVSLTERRVTDDAGVAHPELYRGVGASTCCTSEEGYPCVDQVGRGQSIGSSPNKTQISDPLYIWNNFGGTGSPDVVVHTYPASNVCGGSVGSYIQSGRDYIASASTVKPGYTAYEYPHPGTGLPPPDDSPPTLGSHSPTSGETGWVVTNRTISFDVSDASGIDDSTLLMNIDGSADSSCGSGLTCSFIGDPDTSTILHAVYTHGGDWGYSTAYTVNIEVDDTIPNTLTDSWGFTTQTSVPTEPPGDVIYHIHRP